MKNPFYRITSMTTAMALAVVMTASVSKVEATDFPFVKQVQTGLELGNDTFDFAVGDFDGDQSMDLYAIKRFNTGSGKTELHILSGSSDYKSFSLQTALPIEMGNHFDFALGDYNSDGRLDLYCFKIDYTGSNRMEIHILDGSNNYQSFLLQTATPVETGSHWEYGIADYNNDGRLDVVGIKKNYTGSQKSEVHILNGANNYTNFLLQTAVPIETGAHFSYIVGDFDGDNKPDLFALKRTWTGSGTIELHVLSGSSGFQSFTCQSGLPLELGDNFIFDAYDWDRNGRDDLVAIKRFNTSQTEVHVLQLSSSNNQAGGLCSPVPGGAKFSRKTDDGGWYGYHDINSGVSLGTPVYAIADGTVNFYQAHTSGYLTSYGNYIDFTSSDGMYRAKYCHLNGFNNVSLKIPSSKTWKKSGSAGRYWLGSRNVRAGELIGFIGTTGNSSGVHLHFELYQNGSRVDPTSVFNGLA